MVKSQVRNFGVLLIAGIVALAMHQYRSETSSVIQKAADSGRPAHLAPDASRISNTHAANSLSTQATITSGAHILATVSNDAAVAEFLQSNNLVATHAKLAGMATPQALFVMAHIQDLCRRVADVEKEGIPDPRELPILGSENLDLRQQAQLRLRERSSRKLCKGFPSELLTGQSIKGAYERAGSAGDIRAKLRGLEDRLTAERTSVPLTGNSAGHPVTTDSGIGMVPSLSTSDTTLLRSAFESRDPIAIRAAGPLLAGLYRDVEVSFGPLSGPVDGVVGDATWSLLACKYGGGCDASSTELSEACLLNARCGDSTLQDYLYRYALNPQQLQDVLALVARFQAGIDHGDWSFLQVKPGSGIKFDRTPFTPHTRPFILRP